MRIRIAAEANRDFADIVSYIGARDPHAAQRLIDRVFKTFRLLEENPFIGRRTGISETRQYTIPRSPYLLVYRISGETVEIITIFHASRNPDSRRA